MDAALLDMMHSGRNKYWAETMINLEARKLINIANTMSSFHLRDGLTRIKFVQEIKDVVEQQFAAARRAKSNENYTECIKNLRTEIENLQEQDRMLRTRAAKLYAKVEFIRENNKIVGYVISAVNIVISGLVITGGVAMMSTMTPLGVLAGAILVVDGANGITKEIINLSLGAQGHSEGVMADAAMDIAQFMGFKAESGLAFYRAGTLSASVYGIFGLARKSAAWRLFRWIPHDYYRKMETMSRPKLTMKIVGDGLKAKVLIDLLSIDQSAG
ncbi:DUF4225 domain-containing protein [Serratia rubidaea]|uniref:DUF4225 domain-containing protein n=1 Tax=Serratia rubidaea TaxID=61652 RepID=UPI0023AF876D|nr:DUF4225 domain-containing protein [Serratia rubidaea]MDK1703521.1 DUF4225 domain-containing protein [Serratia rubidaea]